MRPDCLYQDLPITVLLRFDTTKDSYWMRQSQIQGQLTFSLLVETRSNLEANGFATPYTLRIRLCLNGQTGTWISCVQYVSIYKRFRSQPEYESHHILTFQL